VVVLDHHLGAETLPAALADDPRQTLTPSSAG
jgi:hypothetical protein